VRGAERTRVEQGHAGTVQSTQTQAGDTKRNQGRGRTQVGMARRHRRWVPTPTRQKTTQGSKIECHAKPRENGRAFSGFVTHRLESQNKQPKKKPFLSVLRKIGVWFKPRKKACLLVGLETHEMALRKPNKQDAFRQRRWRAPGREHQFSSVLDVLARQARAKARNHETHRTTTTESRTSPVSLFSSRVKHPPERRPKPCGDGRSGRRRRRRPWGASGHSEKDGGTAILHPGSRVSANARMQCNFRRSETRTLSVSPR